jgi:hypothetical protein
MTQQEVPAPRTQLYAPQGRTLKKGSRSFEFNVDFLVGTVEQLFRTGR